MRRSLAGLARLAGFLLVLYAGAMAFMSGGPLTPRPAPAAYTATIWGGAVPAPPQEADYRPSDEITRSARLFCAGIWPFQRSWYEYTPDGPPPKAVVVLLHGAGRDGLSMLDMWRHTADRHGLLLVAPNGESLRFSALGRHAVTASAADATLAHGLDGVPMFLFGHSDGAVLAHMLTATAAPGQWRATALHAGYLPLAEIEAGHSAIPLRLYLGDQDPIFPTGPAEAALQAMATNGHLSELVQIKDHGHWFYRIGPAIAEDAWQWFAASPP